MNKSKISRNEEMALSCYLTEIDFDLSLKQHFEIIRGDREHDDISIWEPLERMDAETVIGMVNSHIGTLKRAAKLK